MGASGWHYVVGYQEDVRAAFTELQKTVLAERDYYRGFDEENTYASMDELQEAKDDEEFWEEGTHSILDMVEVVGSGDEDDVARVRVLRGDEVRELFGTDRPTAADFERFLSGEWEVDRWEGRVTTLYDDGKPASLAFWGISGD